MKSILSCFKRNRDEILLSTQLNYKFFDNFGIRIDMNTNKICIIDILDILELDSDKIMKTIRVMKNKFPQVFSHYEYILINKEMLLLADVNSLIGLILSIDTMHANNIKYDLITYINTRCVNTNLRDLSKCISTFKNKTSDTRDLNEQIILNQIKEIDETETEKDVNTIKNNVQIMKQYLKNKEAVLKQKIENINKKEQIIKIKECTIRIREDILPLKKHDLLLKQAIVDMHIKK